MDVAITFDLPQNMDLARAIKEEMYAHLIPVLHNRDYTDASIHTFVIGSLGSWSLEVAWDCEAWIMRRC